jgi:hypothetical protein
MVDASPGVDAPAAIDGGVDAGPRPSGSRVLAVVPGAGTTDFEAVDEMGRGVAVVGGFAWRDASATVETAYLASSGFLYELDRTARVLEAPVPLVDGSSSLVTPDYVFGTRLGAGYIVVGVFDAEIRVYDMAARRFGTPSPLTTGDPPRPFRPRWITVLPGRAVGVPVDTEYLFALDDAGVIYLVVDLAAGFHFTQIRGPEPLTDCVTTMPVVAEVIFAARVDGEPRTVAVAGDRRYLISIDHCYEAAEPLVLGDARHLHGELGFAANLGSANDALLFVGAPR